MRSVRVGGEGAPSVEGNVYTFNLTADVSGNTASLADTIVIEGVNLPRKQIQVSSLDNCSQVEFRNLIFDDYSKNAGALFNFEPASGVATCQIVLHFDILATIVINYCFGL